VASSNIDRTIDALTLIRRAQRATDAALRLPMSDRRELAGQIDAVRRNADQVAGSLAASVPGGESLLSAGHGLAERREVRALGGLIGFFAGQGSQALDAVAGAASSLGTERDHSLELSERIRLRLAEVGVTTRGDLARELDVDPRSAEFRDALERTLGTGLAEWYGSGTYGLPHDELEAMLARARVTAEVEAAGAAAGRPSPPPVREPEPETEPAEAVPPRSLGSAVEELRGSIDALWKSVAGKAEEEEDEPPLPPP
jgi:hypothetical protein